MREYTTPLKEAFVSGLRGTPDSLKNTDRLTYAKNLRPYEGGLRLQQVPIPVVNGVYTIKWPYPQLAYNTRGFWLLSSDQVCLFDQDLLMSSLVTTTEGHPWSVADFGKFALCMNGAVMVAQDVDSPYYLEAYTNSSVPLGGCCCDFNRSQLIVGDLSAASWYDGADNFVAWSKIGDVSCVPDRSNEAGYMSMDWDGKVYAVKQLGQHVMVYGRGGVSYITPTQSPAVSWGQRHFQIYGVPSHTAVAGDKVRHYFVDLSGDLWRIDANRQLTNLGGKEFIGPMLTVDDIVVTFHPKRDECYISNSEYHYVRTRTGWGGPNYVPISGAAYCRPIDSRTGGLIVVPAKGATQNVMYAEFTTDVVNFGSSGQKTLQWVEVDTSTDAGTMEVAAKYRYGSNESWQQTGWYRCNKEGVGRLSIAGTEFQILVRVYGSTMSYLEADQLRIKWKPTDSRFVRGPSPAQLEAKQ